MEVLLLYFFRYPWLYEVVLAVKPHEETMSKLFLYDGIVECRQTLSFEKMDTASYTGKNDGFDYCEEYLRSTSSKTLLRQC